MKALSRLLIAAIGAAAFASCTQNGSLIYLNIQKVTKTNTSSSIPLDITVSEIVGIGSGGTAPYYVAAGKIYNGTVPSPGSTNWNAIGVPQANGKDMLCNALTWDGTNLWGGFFSSDGSTFGLYSMIPSVGTWTQVTSGPTVGKQITYLNAIGSILFVVAATDSSGTFTYELDAWNGSWAANLLSGLSRPITGVAATTTPTYYATSGNTLYVSTAPYPALAFSPVATLQPGSNDLFQGIFIDPLYSGGPLIMIPNSNQQTQTQGIGSVWFSTNGGLTWSNATTNASTSYNVGFLCVAGPVDSGHTMYLLGTDSGLGGAFGFFSFQPSSNSLNRFGGISYSLYASAVRRIRVDSTYQFVLMGTINTGLWVTSGVDSSGGFGSNSWTQE